MIGMIVIVAGIVWISLEKGVVQENNNSSRIDLENVNFNRLMSIGLALLGGAVNSMVTLHSKYMLRLYKCQPMDISADAAILVGVICGVITFVNWTLGNEDVTSHNLLVGLIASSLVMLCIVVSQNAMVKGLAGPTAAIVYSHSIYCTILQVIFLNLVPTIPQILAALISFGGMLIMILKK